MPTPPTPPAHTELGCELAVRRQGDSLGLAFLLSNRTSSSKTIHYFRPFLQFDLRVLADGADLRIVRGDFDGPAEPAVLDLPPGGTAKLETPVTLQFATTASSPGDAFAWTVIGAPHSIELHATLRIENESFPDCVAHVDRN